MPQTDSQTIAIDKHNYTVRMLPARRATRMLAKLSGMLGPALGTLAEGGKLSDLADAKVDGKLFSRAAMALFAHVDEDAVDAILMELADVTTVEPGGVLKPIYDLHFMGRQGALMKWAGFALRVQYADFFAVASAALADLDARTAEKAEASPSPLTSSGTSGG